MKPLLPLRASQLRASGESSAQPPQAAGVTEAAEETSVSRESLLDCSMQEGNGTSCISQAGITKGWSSAVVLPA